MEVSGSLINLRLRPSGTLAAFRSVVCAESSTFDITSETSERRTNCGVKTGISDPSFTANVTAVQEANPTALQVSYSQLKAWVKGKTKLDFNYNNDADIPNGLDLGEGIQNYGSGYVTSLSASASADADGLLTYDLTISGTGILDNYDDNANS